METLTPLKLINNLNKNYFKMLENALIGYQQFYQIEKDFLSKIPENIKITEVDKDKMNYLIAYSNVIQYGKSYFFGEIRRNQIEMENLTNYINYVTPLMPLENKINSVIIEKLEEGQSGGSSFIYFIQYIVVFLIMSVTNVTSVGQSISLLNDVSVSVNLDINKREMPQAYGFQEELDPSNEDMMIEFTKQYKQNFKFPTDKILNTDVTHQYKKSFTKNIKDSMNIFGLMFMSDKKLDEIFIQIIKEETSKINMLTKVTNIALEEVCRSFVKTTDPNLPIPLYKLLNSEMASKLDKLKEERNKISEEKELIIRKREIERLGLTGTEEPWLGQIIGNDVKSVASSAYNSISNLFPSIKYDSSSLPQQDTRVPTTDELITAYNNVEKSVNNAITELSEEIDLEAFKNIAEEALTKIGKEADQALSETNLRIYLTAVCQIKKPTYIFNVTDGVLYIKDPVSSRAHLKVLAQNVLSYYSTATEGIQRIEKGDVVIDVPSDERQINMKSLLEKSQVIIEILTNYDTGLAKTLSDSDSETDYKTFFVNIASMWMDIKKQTINALSQFPITEREKEIELTRQQEMTMLQLKEKIQLHDSEMRIRLQELTQNKELTDITESEWKLMNKWFSINTGEVLKMGTGIVNNLINSTTEMGTNLLENGELLTDKGMAGILSIAWGIVKLSMILGIPAIMFLSIKSGYITALFKKSAKQLETSAEQTIFQTTKMTVIPKTLYGPYGKKNYYKFKSQQEEGELYSPDILYKGGKFKKHKKTRKNNRRKTRKVKHCKRRKTKQKKLRLTCRN